MLDAALLAVEHLTQLETILALGAGVIIGLIVGVLPGLGGTAGLAMLLPFVYGMDPSAALAMMIGLAAVTATSDTFPAVLMGIPGTSGSQATVMDGFPLAKRGEGARALSVAFVSSLVGGVFGAFVLSFVVFLARPILLSIGFGEQFMLVLLALSMVGILTGINVWKGLAACAMGLMLGALGAAPLSGVERISFGTTYLIDPLPLVIVGLAMFATPEIIDLLRRQSSIAQGGKLKLDWLSGLRDWAQNWWLSIRCAFIGCVVGALPGLGGSVVDWIAYGHAAQTTKNPERYGTGDIRGVIAPESANNAKEGGALVPTLLLGIPGSSGMAILLGGFIIVGINPGVRMVTDHLDLVYTIVWSLAIANVIGAAICFFLAPYIARLTTVRYTLLAPFMIGLIFFAAFQATRSWGDLIALFILGMLGVYMKRFGWPRPALLIGFVLSTQVESSVYQTVALYGFSFLERPIVIIILLLTAFSIFAAVRFRGVPSENALSNVRSLKVLAPQAAFYFLILGSAAYIFWDGLQYNFFTGLYPMVAAGTAVAFLIPLGFQMFVSTRPTTALYDTENPPDQDTSEGHSIEYYLIVILGLLLVSAVLGFVLGVAIFIALFLWRKGGTSPLKAILGSAGFVLFLGVLSQQLVLRYPLGLLQTYLGISLPWPLQ